MHTFSPWVIFRFCAYFALCNVLSPCEDNPHHTYLLILVTPFLLAFVVGQFGKFAQRALKFGPRNPNSYRTRGYYLRRVLITFVACGPSHTEEHTKGVGWRTTTDCLNGNPQIIVGYVPSPQILYFIELAVLLLLDLGLRRQREPCRRSAASSATSGMRLSFDSQPLQRQPVTHAWAPAGPAQREGPQGMTTLRSSISVNVTQKNPAWLLLTRGVSRWGRTEINFIN
ncbi:hypothetical protein BJ912DRAFT_448030 [Pholiota molesta]|nr:hypothetical protein BJ912DRAFT_448030 [Pholiota molesta]